MAFKGVEWTASEMARGGGDGSAAEERNWNCCATLYHNTTRVAMECLPSYRLCPLGYKLICFSATWFHVKFVGQKLYLQIHVVKFYRAESYRAQVKRRVGRFLTVDPPPPAQFRRRSSSQPKIHTRVVPMRGVFRKTEGPANRHKQH
jgi:hypothetical protein